MAVLGLNRAQGPQLGLEYLVKVDMTEDWDLSGWRRLVRDTEAQHRRWQGTIERVLRPSRQFEESLQHMQDILRPNWQLEKLRLMEDALHPNRQLEELRLMEDLLHPNRQLEKSLRQIEDALRPNRQLEESLRHTRVGLIDWVGSFEAPQRQMSALFEKQQQEFQWSRGVLAWQQRSTSLSELHTTLQRLIDDNAHVFGPGELAVGPDGKVWVAGEATDPEEVAASLARLTEDLAAASTMSDYFRRLLEFLASLRRPLAAVLLQLVLPYLILVAATLTTPMIQDYWEHFVGTSRREAILAIQETAESKYDVTHLEGYRFVTATRLRVHAGSEGQEDIIAEIAFGKLVRLLETKGRRALVEFLDDDGNEPCRGWVASRYLAAFSR